MHLLLHVTCVPVTKVRKSRDTAAPATSNLQTIAKSLAISGDSANSIEDIYGDLALLPPVS